MSIKSCLSSICTTFSRKKRVDTTRGALKTELNRCLSTVDLTLIGIGCTLGSGVYVLTGNIAKEKAGPGIALSFFIAGIASVLAGLCYAEFGARVPKAGSAYVYTYATAGELSGFVVGWNLLLEYGIGSATVCKGLSAYLDATVDHKMSKFIKKKTGTIHLLGEETFFDFFAFSFSVLVTIILALGVKNTSRINNICTFANIIVIIMVIAMGAFYCDIKNWGNFAPFGVTGIISGASSCFFAFIGFDAVATVGEEASKPSRSIPISIIGTITICFLAYFGVSAVVTLMVPYYDLEGDSALTKAFDQKGNQIAKYIISVGAIVGLTGTTIVSLMPMPRLLYSMANDGLIFKFLATVNSKTEVPVIATIVTGLLCAVMALVIKLDDLIKMVSIGTLLAYTFVVISVLLLRYHPVEVGLTQGVLSRAISPTSHESRVTSPFQEDIDNRAEGYIHSDQMCKTPPYADSEDELLKGPNLPTDKSYTVATTCVIVGILEIGGITTILAFFLKQLQEKNVLTLIIIILLITALVVTVMVLARQPQNPQKLYFKVPFLPWLPFLSIFFNVYLMLALDKLTWVRFAVWMIAGFLIYFGYGIFHSVERQRTEYEAVEGDCQD